DLTPRNLFLCRDGRVKVLDFGIAKLRHAQTLDLTKAGQIQGTPAFLAPEQARGEDVDPRTDLYQLGATLYYMLSGSPPHRGADTIEVIRSSARGVSRPLVELVPDLPDDVGAIITRATQVDPNSRYATASEMNRAVLAALHARREDGVQATLHLI